MYCERKRQQPSGSPTARSHLELFDHSTPPTRHSAHEQTRTGVVRDRHARFNKRASTAFAAHKAATALAEFCAVHARRSKSVLVPVVSPASGDRLSEEVAAGIAARAQSLARRCASRDVCSVERGGRRSGRP